MNKPLAKMGAACTIALAVTAARTGSVWSATAPGGRAGSQAQVLASSAQAMLGTAFPHDDGSESDDGGEDDGGDDGDDDGMPS